MANYYWVGGSGTWDNTPGNWSTASGGAVSPTLFPTSADNVTFNASSGTGTITIGATATCNNFTVTAIPTGLYFQCIPSNSLNLYGNLSSDTSARSAATFTGSISGTTLTVSAVTSGIIKIGAVLSVAGVALNTTITGGSGLSWTVDVSQTLTSTTIVTVDNYLNLNFVAVAPTTTQTATNTGTAFLGAVTVAGDTLTYNLALGQMQTLNITSGNVTLTNSATISNPLGYSYIDASANLTFATGKTFSIVNAAYQNYFYASYNPAGLVTIALAGATLNIGTNLTDQLSISRFQIDGTTANIVVTDNASTAITIGYKYCAYATESSFEITGASLLGTLTLNNTNSSIQAYSGTTAANSFGTLVRNGGVNKSSTFTLYSETTCNSFNIAGNSVANRLRLSGPTRTGALTTLNSTSTSVASALTNCDIESITGTVGKAIVATSVGDLGGTGGVYSGTGLAVFTGQIVGTILTAAAPTYGTIIVGAQLFGGTTASGTYITALGTGTGGAGTYTVSISQTVAAGTSFDTRGVIYYAVTAGNNFNWSNSPAAGGMWATTSGGVTTTGRIPLAQDQVVFDSNSGSGYITPDMVNLPKITVASGFTGVFSQYTQYFPSDGATVTTTSTTGDFSFTATLGLTISIDQAVQVTGINTGGSGLTAGVYKVSATNNNSTFKLVKLDGTAITTVNAKPSTGLTFTPQVTLYGNNSIPGYLTDYYVYGTKTVTTLIPDLITTQYWYNTSAWYNPGGVSLTMHLMNRSNQTFPSSGYYNRIYLESISGVYTLSASCSFLSFNVISGTLAFDVQTANITNFYLTGLGLITATAGSGKAIVSGFNFNKSSFSNTNLLVNLSGDSSFTSVNGGFYQLKFSNSTGSRTTATVSVDTNTTFAQGWTNDSGNINIKLANNKTFVVNPFNIAGNATYYLNLSSDSVGNQAYLSIPVGSSTYYITYQDINATNTIRAYGYQADKGNNTNILFTQGGGSNGFIIG